MAKFKVTDGVKFKNEAQRKSSSFTNDWILENLDSQDPGF